MKDNPRIVYWKENDGDYVFVNMTKVASVYVGIRRRSMMEELDPEDEIEIRFFTSPTSSIVASRPIDMKKIKDKDRFLKTLVTRLFRVSGIRSLDEIIEDAMKAEG